ncbi:MAG: endolytic transglycosylase MltG [Alphaproteobacteria bacterium]|nr:endolytic transglycosylase MltG [Alphaproteobacteria bacterium]
MDDRADLPLEDIPPPRRRRRLARFLFATFLIGAVAATTIAVAGIWMFNRTFTDPGPLTEGVVLVIPRGASVRSIGALLESEGVIDDATLFSWGVRALGGERPLKAGEYAFPAQISARGAMALLQSGKIVERRLTVPEGLTTLQVLAAVGAADGLAGELPPADKFAEGSLLPETYQYLRGETRDAFLTRLQTAMAETLDQLWRGRSPDASPLKSPQEALILASIVERETGLAAERPRVAAVFLNRLRRGMRLQSDPTVVYGLSNGTGTIGRPITKTDLATDHPYNTYVHAGLPPGPIANPGRASLAAVLQPIKSKDLYFVADGTGGHAFARTLEEHNRNVAKWRRIERQRRKK